MPQNKQQTSRKQRGKPRAPRRRGQPAESTRSGNEFSRSGPDRSKSMSAPRTNLTTIVEANMPLFQARTRKRLYYYDSFAVSATLFGPGSYVFSTNGLYDPNITGTGHQPVGFDQMMAFYEHYTVVRAKIVLTVSNTNTYPCSFVLALNASNTVPTNASDLIESGFQVRDRLTAAGSTGAVKVVELTCNNAALVGYDDILDADEFKGTVASNPTEQSYFIVTGYDPDGKSVALICEAYIIFDAWFTEPRRITPSVTSALHKLNLGIPPVKRSCEQKR